MTDGYYEEYEVYDGSKLFYGVSESVGLPIDLFNFLIAQGTALVLAGSFRSFLRFASAEVRHSVCLVLGIFMAYFCYGKQSIHLIAMPMVSYILLRILKPKLMGNVVLAVSMVYLSCLHFHRQIYQSQDYALDISGPLMVITQRVTSLAYSLHDGLLNISKLSDNAGDDMPKPLKKIPTPLEFFAFTLAFQTLLCGPVVFYHDYILFIEQESYILNEFQKNPQSEMNVITMEPSPRRAVMYKMTISLAAAVLYLYFVKIFPVQTISGLVDPTSEISRTWSSLYLLWYAYVSTLVVRCKYYHAWLLAEAVCNNSGLGYNGVDGSGVAKWDRVSNIDILGFEFSNNFRTSVAAWNKNTNTWLRWVAYMRGGTGRTTRVYSLSAVWHGFHPGYYFTFSGGALCTMAAKRMRGVARPLFQQSKHLKSVYNVLSFTATRVYMTYITVPFILLDLAPSLAFYGRFYYSLHFLALSAFLLPAKRSPRVATTSNNGVSPSQSTDNGHIKPSITVPVVENGKMKMS